MTFKEIAEKYPKGYEEFVNFLITVIYGINPTKDRLYAESSFIESKNIRNLYSDIVDFFDGKGIGYIDGFGYEPKRGKFEKKFWYDILLDYKILKPCELMFVFDDRKESQTAGLEMLFKIYEERLIKNQKIKQ